MRFIEFLWEFERICDLVKIICNRVSNFDLFVNLLRYLQFYLVFGDKCKYCMMSYEKGECEKTKWQKELEVASLGAGQDYLVILQSIRVSLSITRGNALVCLDTRLKAVMWTDT